MAGSNPFVGGKGLFTSSDPGSALRAHPPPTWAAVMPQYLTPQIADSYRQAGIALVIWEPHASQAGVQAVQQYGAQGYIAQAEGPAELAAAQQIGSQIGVPKALVTNNFMSQYPPGWMAMPEAYTNNNPNATPDQVTRDAQARGATQVVPIIGLGFVDTPDGRRMSAADYNAGLARAGAAGAVGSGAYIADQSSDEDLSTYTSGAGTGPPRQPGTDPATGQPPQRTPPPDGSPTTTPPPTSTPSGGPPPQPPFTAPPASPHTPPPPIGGQMGESHRDAPFMRPPGRKYYTYWDQVSKLVGGDLSRLGFTPGLGYYDKGDGHDAPAPAPHPNAPVPTPAGMQPVPYAPGVGQHVNPAAGLPQHTIAPPAGFQSPRTLVNPYAPVPQRPIPTTNPYAPVPQTPGIGIPAEPGGHLPYIANAIHSYLTGLPYQNRPATPPPPPYVYPGF